MQFGNSCGRFVASHFLRLHSHGISNGAKSVNSPQDFNQIVIRLLLGRKHDVVHFENSSDSLADFFGLALIQFQFRNFRDRVRDSMSGKQKPFDKARS